MTDRELLELAARAAGLTNHAYCEAWKTFAAYDASDDRFYGPSWNPLTDDGDALRLAVKLHINLRHLSFLVPESAEVQAGICGEFWPGEKAQGDACAATRRAIIRAAAEIGKETK